MIRLLKMEVSFLFSIFVFTEVADSLDGQSEVEEPMKMHTDLLCRVCACTSEELVPVFGREGSELQLLDKIHVHLPIMVKTYTDFVLLLTWVLYIER
jgi:hypothetical protein